MFGKRISFILMIFSFRVAFPFKSIFTVLKCQICNAFYIRAHFHDVITVRQKQRTHCWFRFSPYSFAFGDQTRISSLFFASATNQNTTKVIQSGALYWSEPCTYCMRIKVWTCIKIMRTVKRYCWRWQDEIKVLSLPKVYWSRPRTESPPPSMQFRPPAYPTIT